MLSDRTGQIEKLEFARRAGGQVVTNVVCNRFHPFNFGMIAPGNHLDLDSLRAAPPARYRSVVRKFGICRGKPGRRTTLSFRTSAHTGVGISIEFRTIYRHPFVGDGFPVPRNSETCMGRDGRPVPYEENRYRVLRQIPICRATERYRAGQVGSDYRPRSSRLGRPPCGQIPICLSSA